jgi:nickel/cobalt exporter
MKNEKRKTTGSFFILHCLVILAICLMCAPTAAHPVPRQNHDRTIVVRLHFNSESKQVEVQVDYRLEVDEFTVITDDLKPFRDEVNPNLRGPAFYGEFTRIYTPIFASHLAGQANGKPLTFTCLSRKHTLVDENGQNLGHLRCDFLFEAKFTPRTNQENRSSFKENNYQLQEGKVILSLAADSSIRLISKTEPGAALQERPATDRRPGDDDKLRTVSAVFLVDEAQPVTTPAKIEPAKETARPRTPVHDDSLLHLFTNSEYGFWLLMMLAMWFGAVHALTPGHGKTLVAAYLVGEQGTVWHALLLGIITTVTHTGVVILFAVGLLFVPPSYAEEVQTGLGLVMGLIIAGLGLWLLLKRLAGGHDHIHLGGGHHHHHHSDAHHHHDHLHDHVPDHDHPHSHGDISALAGGSRLNTWGLIVLGVTGGIIPCWDAIALLFFTMGTKQFWLALPALLAFSAGLAGVLVAIGILVVKVRMFAGSKWGSGRFVRALPIVSAIFVAAIGLWLCYASVSGGTPP